MYVNKNTVSHLKEFGVAEEFTFLFDFLHQQKTRIQPPKKRINWNHKTFEKLYWRASDDDVFLLPGETKLPAGNVLHHGFHYLLNRRFPARLKNMPQLTLLSETMASSLDFYFASVYLEKSGKKHFFTQHFVNQCHKFGKMKKPDVVRALTLTQAAAFEKYKVLNLEMFDFCLMLLSYCSQDQLSESSVKIFNRKLSKLRYRSLYAHFDFVTFFLYTLGFCTTKSSKKDVKMVRDLQHKLASATSMLDFFESLKTS